MFHAQNKSWQPSASLSILAQRAQFLQAIRSFFAAASVMEVDTPLLCDGVATDPGLNAFVVATELQKYRYLQTSPEFPMKRLIAFGSGPIYYLGKAFRKDELGAKHNPEFTLLEWYRPGWDHFQLIEEVDSLFQRLLNCPPAKKVTYLALFEQRYGIHPHLASMAELQKIAFSYDWTSSLQSLDLDKEAWLDLLFIQGIEPTLGENHPVVILDYPAEQASLAKIKRVQEAGKDFEVAERFEFYYKGIELANGYHELTCEREQRLRFEKDISKRKASGLDELPIDEKLMGALTAGLPSCAGVALGVDRLFMIKVNGSEIAKVIPFAWEYA